MADLTIPNLPETVKGINTIQLLITLGLSALNDLVAANDTTPEKALEDAAQRYADNKDKIDELAAKGH